MNKPGPALRRNLLITTVTALETANYLGCYTAYSHLTHTPIAIALFVAALAAYAIHLITADWISAYLGPAYRRATDATAWAKARDRFDRQHAGQPVWPAADYETWLNLHTAV